MPRIAHRTFLQPPLDVRIFKPFPDLDEEIRQQAEAFIHEIGIDRVVSITERITNESRFVVVVWYRVEEGSA
jgi:hypothetical protein